MAGFNMEDYVSVNERIEAFYKAHPHGSIQAEIHTLTDKLVVMKAVAYREPGDTLPCIAHSQLGIPGKTSFTKDSEVENAETSAVGRALAMMGFEVKRGMASKEEVQNKRAPRETANSVPEQVPPAVKQEKPEWADVLVEILNDAGMRSADLAGALGVQRVTFKEIQKYIDGTGAHPRIALEGLVLSAKGQITADGDK